MRVHCKHDHKGKNRVYCKCSIKSFWREKTQFLIFWGGDENFQRVAAENLGELTPQSGAMPLATHSMKLGRDVCNKLVAFAPDGMLLNFDDPETGVNF